MHKYFVKLSCFALRIWRDLGRGLYCNLTISVFHISVVEAKSLNGFIEGLDKFPEDRSITTCLSH